MVHSGTPRPGARGACCCPRETQLGQTTHARYLAHTSRLQSTLPSFLKLAEVVLHIPHIEGALSRGTSGPPPDFAPPRARLAIENSPAGTCHTPQNPSGQLWGAPNRARPSLGAFQGLEPAHPLRCSYQGQGFLPTSPYLTWAVSWVLDALRGVLFCV